jgi:hypothetical protein
MTFHHNGIRDFIEIDSKSIYFLVEFLPATRDFPRYVVEDIRVTKIGQSGIRVAPPPHAFE